MGSVTLMGLASLPHCAAMCGSTCHWGLRHLSNGARIQGVVWVIFLALRAMAYATLGGLAQSTVQGLREWMSFSDAFRPVWTLLHLGALVLGLWLMVTGKLTLAWRTPAWLKGRTHSAAPAEAPVLGPGRLGSRQALTKAASLGALWVLWPCTMLWSAVMTAALSNSWLSAFIGMGLFALVSAPGLWSASRLWAWLESRTTAQNRARLADRNTQWALRCAGVLLAAAALWSLAHDLLRSFWAWCFG